MWPTVIPPFYMSYIKNELTELENDVVMTR